MQAQKQETPRCYTLVMGCCKDGKCTNAAGSCGCGDGCTCPDTADCKRTNVRVTPDLGGGNGMLYAGALVVLAGAAAAAAFVMKNKKD